MNEYDFYNLLERRVELREIKNGIFEYPKDFIGRWAENTSHLKRLVKEVKNYLSIQTDLEKEQFKYTAGANK